MFSRNVHVRALAALVLLAAPIRSEARTIVEQARLQTNTRVSLVAQLPLRNVATLDALIAAQGDAKSPLYHHWLTPAQFRASFGSTPAAISATARALSRHGFTIDRIGSQLMHFSGSVANVERTFSTRMMYDARSVRRRNVLVAASTYRIPADLTSTGARMLALAATPELAPQATLEKTRMNRNGTAGPYWFDDLKQAYEYPAYQGPIGRGRTIAIVSGGDYSKSDADAYFNHELLGGPGALAPEPDFRAAYVGGAVPAAFDPTSEDDEEADIDVQQAGGSGPGAVILSIKDNGPVQFADAFEYIDDSDNVDIASISYAACELAYLAPISANNQGASVLLAYHAMFQQGNSEGITFVAGSGDMAGTQCAPAAAYANTAGGGTYAPVASVSSLADDPDVTAVGGTNLQTTALSNRLTSSYLSETAYANLLTDPQPDPYAYGNLLYPQYFGSGGGISAFFKEPVYQRFYGLRTSGRAVPDVSMQMGGCVHHTPSICRGDESAIEAYVDGSILRLIGTSAAAPEFAGLLAVKEEATHERYGNENYDLYLLAELQRLSGYRFFHEGIPGNNGLITVAAGDDRYNVINGIGTPIGDPFAFSAGSPLAGRPQTRSNP